eukprot:CAMPEP_0115002082 /NCGR_PEP_ID=MMETSP0216-20121206/17790_1 /TAXON_ID=223996 /ORGANISM="Protocruzia adherens, Strain Boccale" /LENGTH=417 /DNA_ID=CAMNT_0002367601 /DNA_START=25 /DNA_END=1278 /DNA_ORIENTATION=+
MNTSKCLLYGAFGVGTAALGAWIYLNLTEGSQKVGVPCKTLTKEEVIQIMQGIQNQLFSILNNVAQYSMGIKQQTGFKITDDEVKAIVLKDLKSKIEDAVNYVYEKKGITEGDLEHAVNVTFKDDSEVQKKATDMKNQYDRAFKGVPVDADCEVPEWLTPSLVIKIHKKSNEVSHRKIYDKFKSLEAQGIPLNMQDPRIMEALNSVQLEEVKLDVLKANLADVEHPDMVFHAALKKYQSTNQEFEMQMRMAEGAHQGVMQCLFRGALSQVKLCPLSDNYKVDIEKPSEETQTEETKSNGKGEGTKSEEKKSEETKTEEKKTEEKELEKEQTKDAENTDKAKETEETNTETKTGEEKVEEETQGKKEDESEEKSEDATTTTEKIEETVVEGETKEESSEKAEEKTEEKTQETETEKSE